MDEPFPTQIERQGDGGLRITWSDGQQRIYGLPELRAACPCATCNEKRRQRESAPPNPRLLPVLSEAETRPLTVESMSPIGSYAYGIRFSDGHDTGIYSFELLRALGQPVTPPAS